MKKTKYFPLIQKPNCCSVACLQMILFRHGYMNFLQDEIAKEVGVMINRKNKNAFATPLKIKSKETYINRTPENVDKVNRFFKKNKIRLCATSYKLSEIEDPIHFIKNSLANDHDVQVEFLNKPMFGTTGGHNCLISHLKKKRGKQLVTLVDPSDDRPQIYDVSFDTLLLAMQKNSTLKPARQKCIMIVKKI